MRKFFRNLSIYAIVFVVWTIASYLIAFLHYETVDISESESYSVVISDLKYHSNSGRRRRSWASFDASGVPAYYVFEENGISTSEEFKILQHLAEEKTEVTITYTDYKSYTDWNRLLETSGRKRIVDIRYEDRVIFDVDEFNRQMQSMIILWSVIATFFLLEVVGYFVLYTKNDFNKL